VGDSLGLTCLVFAINGKFGTFDRIPYNCGLVNIFYAMFEFFVVEKNPPRGETKSHFL